MSINISQMSFVSIHDQTQKYNYKKILNIQQSPTILILDHNDILLQTTDPNDIYKFTENLAK